MDIIDNNNDSGILINENFQNWHNVKNQSDYDKWVTQSKELRFGTYSQFNILDIINNFNPKQGFLFDSYKKELSKILN